MSFLYSYKPHILYSQLYKIYIYIYLYHSYKIKNKYKMEIILFNVNGFY